MQQTNNKEMDGQRLPEIERIGVLAGGQGSSRRGRTYQRAVSELKQVRRKVSVVRNRLNFLLFKQQEAQHTLSAYYQQNHSRLRALAEEDQQKLKQQLSAKKLRTQSEVQLKRRCNQQNKRESLARIGQARRMVTQQKMRAHQQVRINSEENLKLIQSFRLSFLQQKQTRRQLIHHQEIKQLEGYHNQQQKRVKDIRQQTEEDTKRIYLKIEEKERELKAIEQECSKFERMQQDRLAQHRERKIQKLKHRRLATLQIQDRSTADAYKPSSSPSTTPHSCMSFVIIS